MSSSTEFPQVRVAYDKYVEELSVAPTNPTQLIRYCQKEGIDGITWAKCSKFFKSLSGSTTGHQKSTSGPLLSRQSSKEKQSTTSNGADSSSASPMIVVTGPVAHKRTQSAVTPRTSQKLRNGLSSGITGIGSKFTDLKEEADADKKHDDLEEDEDFDDDDHKMNGSSSSSHSTVSNGHHPKFTANRVSKPKSKRISLTPPGMKASTSFKTLPLEEDGPSVAVQRSSKKVSIIKKHSLMAKPWNKNKPPLWPKNR